MGRRNIIIEKLEITDIVAEGKSLGRDNDVVVFVTDVVPGDIVDVHITKRKTSFKEGIPVKFHKYSELRKNAECKHFELCGGCRWQNIHYEQQLKYKQKIVQDAFDRIAKVEIKEIRPILASDEIFYYRNKLEYTFSCRRWLEKHEMGTEKPAIANGVGFHLPKMFDRIINIEKCHLQSELSNKIRNSVRDFGIENELGFYDTRAHKGFLRNLIVRNSITTGEYMIIVVFGTPEKEKRELFLEFIKNNFPEVVSIYYLINEKINDTYYDLDAHLYYGKEFITEQFNNLNFRIGPKSFFQTNTKQAKNLYDIALEFADLKGTETVYDLFTGTGTIALYASQKAKKVIGIESIKAAIEDAKVNAQINNITNCEFFVGEVEKLLNHEFVEKNGKPDVVIFDPPRAGVHSKAIEVILDSNPEKIVYVSCNPGTQARDVALMSVKYDVLKIQPVDMFPHTFHVENVALLQRKK